MSEIERLRAAGKLTIADEEDIVRLDHEVMTRAVAKVREIVRPHVEANCAAYERAKAAAGQS